MKKSFQVVFGGRTERYTYIRRLHEQRGYKKWNPKKFQAWVFLSDAWNTEKGVRGSTTHNVYGVYDMSGGSWEKISAYAVNGEAAKLAEDVGINNYCGALWEAQNTGLEKYVQVYDGTYKESDYGDAMWETSSSGSSPYTFGCDETRIL